MANSKAESGKQLDPEHIGTLYTALAAAGLEHLSITSMQLSPTADVGDGRKCHMQKQSDGTWKIVCQPQ